MHGLIGESFSYKDLVSACAARCRQQLDAAAAETAAAAASAEAAKAAKAAGPVLVDMHLSDDSDG